MKGTQILTTQVEVKNGAIAFVAYYLGPTTVVTVSNLDKPDMQALRATLDAAFAAGKKVQRIENKQMGRDVRNAAWYAANDYPTTVAFHDVQAGDNVVLRILP